MQEVEKAGLKLREAWLVEGDDDESGTSSSSGSADRDEEGEGDAQFQAQHMDLVTHAFADELEALRSGRPSAANRGAAAAAAQSKKKKKKARNGGLVDNDDVEPEVALQIEDDANAGAAAPSIDVQVLADCLRTTGDVWTDEERELLLLEGGGYRRRRGGTTLDGADAVLTPHERRRRALGFA